MTDKNSIWSIRKNKFAVFYYLLMIIFAAFMLMIASGAIDTNTIYFWWQT